MWRKNVSFGCVLVELAIAAMLQGCWVCVLRISLQPSARRGPRLSELLDVEEVLRLEAPVRARAEKEAVPTKLSLGALAT